MKISTSILNADNRVESVLKLDRTNTSYIHIDVMDGKFVDDIQFKINEISAVNRVSKYPLDVHLMVNDPIKYILELKNMNIEYITFHLEIRRSKEKIISKIKEMGYKVGISIKPDTDVEKLKPYLKEIDMVLVMSVEPGKGGQKFLDSTTYRVNQVKKLIDESGYDIKIEVDGGINDETISKLDNIDIAVVGSYIIKNDNYYTVIENLLNVTNKDNNSLVFNREVISNFLTGIGLFFIVMSFCMDLGKSFNFVWLINSHPLIFLVGFFGLSIGLFIRPFKLNVDEATEIENTLKKEKLLYSILLIIGIIFYLILLFIWLYDSLVIGWGFEIIIGLMFVMLCWPIFLVGMLFIVVSMVRLNEIKRLSKK